MNTQILKQNQKSDRQVRSPSSPKLRSGKQSPVEEIQNIIGNHGILELVTRRGFRISDPHSAEEQDARKFAHDGATDIKSIDAATGGRSANSTQPDLEYNRLLGQGRHLDEQVRKDFEDRLGTNLEEVKVHTGMKARDAAASIDARAFSIGHHIALQNPEDVSDSKLLAHELAHVVQGKDKLISRNGNGHVTQLPEVTISLSQREYARTLRSAGWRKVDIIILLKDFRGQPMTGRNVFAEFRAPGVAPTHPSGPISNTRVTGGTLIYSDVWLQPQGTMRLMAISNTTASGLITGNTFYSLPSRGPMKFEAKQQSREVTISAQTREEATNIVSTTMNVGVDFEVVSIGGEVSAEQQRTRGVSVSRQWKVLIPGNAFDLSQKN